jgi:two-component system, LuxR family, response regulator FixJ
MCLLATLFTEQQIGRVKVNDIQQKTGIIAIVDDDEPLREALASVMKAAGFSTNTFASAEDYLDSAHRQDTMCLILDMRLPGMSGIELQRRLLDANSRVPIIFVTAHADASLRDLVIKAGAAGFLNKPVRSDALLKEIRAALKNTGTNEHS